MNYLSTNSTVAKQQLFTYVVSYQRAAVKYGSSEVALINFQWVW